MRIIWDKVQFKDIVLQILVDKINHNLWAPSHSIPNSHFHKMWLVDIQNAGEQDRINIKYCISGFGVLEMLRLITNFLWVPYFLLRQKMKKKKNPSKIISLIKFRTSGERPSCAHELEKYWACPQRRTGLYRGWLIVNKMGGMFPRQPVEHQQCHHALLAVN